MTEERKGADVEVSDDAVGMPCPSPNSGLGEAAVLGSSASSVPRLLALRLAMRWRQSVGYLTRYIDPT